MNRLVNRASIRGIQRYFVVSIPLSVLILGLFLYFNFSNPKQAYAAVSGDYRSIATGNWGSTSTWETYNGSSWVAAGVTPGSTNNVITIQTGHTVTIAANVTVDQVVVDAGGTLIVQSAKTMTLANGTGDDLTVNGILTIGGTLAAQASTSTIDNGTVTLSSGGSHTFAAGATININTGDFYIAQSTSFTTTTGIWTINSGATFQYDVNGGSLPLATWNSGSTCIVTGLTSTVPGNLTQTFHHFTWNCAGQTSTEKLSGLLTTVNGDFTCISSGAGRLRFTQQESFTLRIGGDFYMQGGLLYVSCKGAADSILVTGNYIQTGGTFGLTDGTTEGGITPTYMTVNNFSLSNGTFDMTSNVGNSSGNGVTALMINGNYNQTGGTFTETATTGANYGYGNVYYCKTGTQTFERSAGTMSNNVNFTVNTGSILDMNTYSLAGAGTFNLSSGGALILASPDGISSSGATGNVQVTGTRTFSTSANYTYDATSAQVTGSGLPASVNNLNIDNSGHVSLTNTTSVSGILTLTNGQLITNANELVVTNAATSSINSFSSTKYIRGNLRRYVNTTGSYDFPIGTSAYYELININFSSMTGFTNVLSSFTNDNPINPSYPLTGIAINGTTVDSMLNYGYWTVTPNSAMTGGTYSITLNEKGHTNSAGTPASYCVLKRANSTSSWQTVGTHSSTTQSESGGTATALRTGLNSFSQFSIGKNSGIGGLPIQLIKFDVKRNKDVVDIVWSTASEINNDYFTIERSINGIQFEELHRISGAGNSTIINKYEDADAHPFAGTSYYRLKQTDYDGRFTYSAIKSVDIIATGFNQLNLKITAVFPNPFSEKLTVAFESKVAAEIKIRLINSTGQIEFEEYFNAALGNNEYNFSDKTGLKPGVYIFEIESDGAKDSKRVIKK